MGELEFCNVTLIENEKPVDHLYSTSPDINRNNHANWMTYELLPDLLYCIYVSASAMHFFLV